MDDTYAYEQDLQDDVDTLDFGKYKGLTPFDIFKVDPAYIVWVWNNTPRWVGSEKLVKLAFKQAGGKWRERTAPPAPTSSGSEQDIIAACEEAILETFGIFPKPPWMR